MALASQGLFQGSQEITIRYEEQKVQPNIASQELLFWHVPTGSVGENSLIKTTWQVIDHTADAFGQSFTIGVNGPNTDIVTTGITWWMKRNGSPGTITCKLTTADSLNKPTTTILATGTTDGDTLTTLNAGEARKIIFSSSVILRFGVTYTVYCEAAGADASNNFYMAWGSGSPYGAVNSGVGEFLANENGTGWLPAGNADFYFSFEVGPSDVALINLFGTLKQIPLLDVVTIG